jgi:hypothetical protein
MHKGNRRNAIWITYVWSRNCLLKRVVEGNIEGRKRETKKG